MKVRRKAGPVVEARYLNSYYHLQLTDEVGTHVNREDLTADYEQECPGEDPDDCDNGTVGWGHSSYECSRCNGTGWVEIDV